jgi:hypothetical protein
MTHRPKRVRESESAGKNTLQENLQTSARAKIRADECERSRADQCVSFAQKPPSRIFEGGGEGRNVRKTTNFGTRLRQSAQEHGYAKVDTHVVIKGTSCPRLVGTNAPNKVRVAPINCAHQVGERSLKVPGKGGEVGVALSL